jgi:hypothetical protein
MMKGRGLTAILIIMLLLVLGFSSYALPNVLKVSWQQMYGGNDDESTRAIFQTEDGGYLIGGVSRSSDISGLTNGGRYDYHIVKTDGDGNIEWQQMIGGNGDDSMIDIQQTMDGGYLIGGISDSTDLDDMSSHGMVDYLIVKLDANGLIEWKKLYGGDKQDVLTCFTQTADGGYIFGGHTYSTEISGEVNHGESDCHVMKLDSEGNVVWQRMIGGSAIESITAVYQTADSKFVFGGLSYSEDIPGTTNSGERDCYLVKLDGDGNVEWQHMAGGSGIETPTSFVMASDGGYVFGGDSESTDIFEQPNHGIKDVHVVKFDKDGNLAWQKLYGGSNYDHSLSLYPTMDGGYISAGFSLSTDIAGLTNQGQADCYMIKFASDGTVEWQQMTGGNLNDIAEHVATSIDGSYIVGGQTDSQKIDGLRKIRPKDFYIVKLDSVGSISWQQIFGGSKSEILKSLQVTSDGGLILGGVASSPKIQNISNNGSNDHYLIKLR